MSNKLSKKKQIILKILGPDLGGLIFDKIRTDISDLPTHEMLSIIYSMCNYIDSNTNISYYKLDDIKLSDIRNIWLNFLNEFKQSYNSANYIEHNKIILDYRENNIGYYWVDLQKLFCIESMIRMEDCGRVNYGKTTLELREQTDSSNISHMIIVYEYETGNIRQVKGKSSLKPPISEWVWFYKFLMDTDYKINEYIPTYKPKTDLMVSDLNLFQRMSIYSKHPNLNKTKSIL
jgi:hypothetical protein